jgi:hypothetical protein
LIGRDLVGGEVIGGKLIGGHHIANHLIGGYALKTADRIKVDISDIECYIRCIDTGVDLDIVYDNIASRRPRYTRIGHIASTD